MGYYGHALHKAIHCGVSDAELLQQLVANGDDVNSCGIKGFTTLLMVVEANIDVAKFLIGHGALPDESVIRLARQRGFPMDILKLGSCSWDRLGAKGFC